MGQLQTACCCNKVEKDTDEVGMHKVLQSSSPRLYKEDEVDFNESKLREEAEAKLAALDAEAKKEEEEDRRRQAEMKAKGGQRRAGIAAESMDMTDVKNYVKPVYKKDEAAQTKIRETLRDNAKMAVLFGHLDGQALEDVINAFQVVNFKCGQDIIRQGEEGDRLYICADGKVDVYVKRPGHEDIVKDPEGKGDKVVTLGAGALFGELALMYQAPRAATVTIASATCTAWALDREPFKMLLAQSGASKLEMYEGFLKEVPLLQSLNHFELSKLSDCLDSQLFEGDEEIIKQGDNGEEFFIVEDGTCSAFINGKDGEIEVKKYEKGGYFGEIALLTDEPRKATIRATGEGTSVMVCTKEHFVNLLGPIQEILKREIDKYPQYEKFLK